MALASVRLFVDDLGAAAAFYRERVGLVPVWEGEDAIVFGEDPMIVVESADAAARAEGLLGRFAGVAFWTDDAERLARELHAAGVPIPGPPARQPWGGVLMHVRDPAGNTISFLQDDRRGGAQTGGHGSDG